MISIKRSVILAFFVSASIENKSAPPDLKIFARIYFRVLQKCIIFSILRFQMVLLFLLDFFKQKLQDSLQKWENCMEKFSRGSISVHLLSRFKYSVLITPFFFIRIKFIRKARLKIALE